MGMIQHQAIIVTSILRPKLMKARRKAVKLFGKANVTPITGQGINGHETFVVVPTGSQLYWPEADKHAAAMIVFREFLDEFQYEDGSTSVPYVEVNYGEFGLQAADNKGNELDSNNGKSKRTSTRTRRTSNRRSSSKSG